MSLEWSSRRSLPIISSFRWKGGRPGRLESIITFNSLAVEYDKPRPSTTFASHLVTRKSDTKEGLTPGIASSLVTADDVAPDDFTQRATSQSRWLRKGAQTEAPCVA
jgi:hypothetical protein